MNNFKFNAMRRGVMIILIMLMMPGIRLTAQNSDMERLNAYKIGFYTRRLNLSSQEAEKFWPVYNDYQKQRNKIYSEKGTINRSFNQNATNLDDNKLTELGDKLINIMVQESTIAVTFHKKLKIILPPEKVLRFYQVENQYKVQLLKRLQGQRQQQRGTPGRDL